MGSGMQDNNLNIGTLWTYSKGRLSEDTLTTLKMKINQFIFLNGNPQWTLKEANFAAEAIWERLLTRPEALTAFKDMDNRP